MIRTSLPKDRLDANAAVAAYKSLAHVERAFRSMKTVDLNVRPVFHCGVARVRAQVFLCMLAYCVGWHMRARLKPMLFDDEYLAQASASRASPAAKAVRSEQAKAKDASMRADAGLPLHGFRTLLKGLENPGLQHHPHRAQPRSQDRPDHKAHTAAGQGLQTARARSLLYPVAPPCRSTKITAGADLRPGGRQSSG